MTLGAGPMVHCRPFIRTLEVGIRISALVVNFSHL